MRDYKQLNGRNRTRLSHYIIASAENYSLGMDANLRADNETYTSSKAISN